MSLDDFDLTGIETDIRKIIDGVAKDRNYAAPIAQRWQGLSLLDRLPGAPKRDKHIAIHDVTRRWLFAIGVVAGKQVIDKMRLDDSIAKAVFEGSRNFRPQRYFTNHVSVAINGAMRLEDPSFAARLASLQPFAALDSKFGGVADEQSLTVVRNDLGTGVSVAAALATLIQEKAIASGNRAIIRDWPLIVMHSVPLLHELASVTNDQFFDGNLRAVDPKFFELRDGRRGWQMSWKPPYSNVNSMPKLNYKGQNTGKTLGDIGRMYSVSGCPAVRPFSVTDSSMVPPGSSNLISPITEILVLVTSVMARPEFDEYFTHNYGETVLGDARPDVAYQQLCNELPMVRKHGMLHDLSM